MARAFFRGRFLFIFCVSLFFLCFSVPARAETIRAGVLVNRPFAMILQDGTFSGMAIDLWEMVAKNLNLSVRYVEYPTVESLLSAAESGEIDVIVSNLYVTYDRARSLRFSYPWYDTGLRIMVNEDAPADVWGQLKRSGALRVYGVILAVMGALSVAWALLRRKRDPDFPPRWRDALPMTFFEVFLAARSGRLDAKHLGGWLSYAVTTVWMVCGLVTIAYVTSTFTSAMTTASLKFDIDSVRDLPGKTVGVPAGGAESAYLQRLFVQTVSFEHMEEMIEALEEHDIDAIVTDAPVLEYWLHRNPQSKNEVVGGIFFTNKYAFAANAKHAELMDDVSLEIIRLQEMGAIRGIRDKYFGNSGI